MTYLKPTTQTHMVLQLSSYIYGRIVHQPIQLPTIIQPPSILLKTKNNEILVTTVYKLPRAILDPKDLDIYTKFIKCTIAVGNLNTKHNYWHSQILYNHLSENYYSVTPTHYPFAEDHKSEVLNIALVC